MSELRYDGAALFLSFSTVEGSQYAIESTTDLTADTWEVLVPAMPGTGQTVEVSLPVVREEPQRFFRVSVAQP
jgi:hypothetical protein